MSARTTVGPLTLVVKDTAQCDREGRPVYAWLAYTGVTPREPETWSGEDLRGPAAGPEPSEESMLDTLLAFLSAALESRARRARRARTGRAGENEDLFPSDMLDWLDPDDVELARLERKEVNP